MNRLLSPLNAQSAPHAPQSRATSMSGFTLVEVLLSLWIMSIMALMSWQSIDAMVRAREKSLSSVNEVSMIQTALAQWQTDLDQALSADSSSQLPGLNWDGQTLKMVRRSSASWDAQGDPGLWVVAWTLRSLSTQDPSPAFSKFSNQAASGLFWMRWQSPAFKTPEDLNRYWLAASSWGKNASAEEKAFETVLIPIQNWQIYYYRLNAWSNPLSSAASISNTASSDPFSAAMTSTAASNASATPMNGSNASNMSNASNSSNASNANSSSPQALAMPDGIRLKLFLGPMGTLASTNVTSSGTDAPLPSLTLDWVRPNYSSVR